MTRLSSLSRLAVAHTGQLLATGCTQKIAQGNPRPNIDLPESKAGMKLVMSSRLKPNVIWVKSLVPKEKNSASSAIRSAVSAARGTSIIVPIR